MAFTEEQVMLTLAGLAYRGFQDVLPGEPHEHVVRQAVQDGLDDLEPVRGAWELAWGPVTSRVPHGVFDSSAMYVVRSVAERRRYVIAIRGTNPVAATDWFLGDLLVATTVDWPFAPGAALSTSTALGLATLQEMRWSPPSVVGRFADAAHRDLNAALAPIVRAGRAWLSGSTESQAAHPSAVEAQVEKVVAHWVTTAAQRTDAMSRLQAAGGVRLASKDLRQSWQKDANAAGGIGLLTFLRQAAEAAGTALDVVVTGHSKGGALAPAVALWLAETRTGVPDSERWDATGQAKVRCYAFAGPTPGNDAFAARVDATLGPDFHRIANQHDLVPHAWDAEDLRKIPKLYGLRTASLAPLTNALAAAVEPLKYRHPAPKAPGFAGTLSPARPLAAELISQHMDAYLAYEKLFPKLTAVDFFVG